MALTVAVALVPWLAMLPIANGALSVALYACALIASFHGWGIAVARRRDIAPLRAIQWGIAALVGIAGIAIAIGVYTAVVEVAIVFAGVAIHTVALVTHRRRPDLAGARYWIVPVGALVVIGAVAVIGSAGDFASRPFDDDGNLLGEVRRLADTGTLGDAVGYPRAFQLGGHAALAALANVVGDPRVLRMIDALGFALALAYAVGRIRPRDAHAALWAVLAVLAASALALSVSDPSPTWLGVGLMLALFDEDVPAIPLGLVAGALIALRLAFAPLAVVGLVWGTRGDRRRMLAGAAAALAVVAPYLIASARATSSSALATHGLAGKLAIAAAIALAMLPLVVVALRELRGVAFASAAGLAGIAAQLTGDHGARFAWAIAIACLLALAIELARRPQTLQVAGLVVALLVCVLIHEGRDAPGRANWYRRTSDLVDNISYLSHSTIGPPRDLDAILDAVPAGAMVALWIPEPERIDHARHRIVDLRTPRIAPLREHRWDDRPSRLAALVAELHIRYLLIAPDDLAAQRRLQNLFERGACATPSPICDDPLAALARHVVARRDGLELVELR